MVPVTGGRTGTVSLPSDFESDTSANSITPAHNIMIIAEIGKNLIKIKLPHKYKSERKPISHE